MSSLLPPPSSRTRSTRNSITQISRPGRPSDIDTTQSSIDSLQSTEARVKDAVGAQSPSRLPVTRSSSSSSSSLLRTASLSGRAPKDGSMPPPSRISTKPPGRSETSRPPVTRSAVLDAEKRPQQRQSSISRPTRAGSISSNTDSNSSRQRSIPTAAHGRTVSTSTNVLTERTSLQGNTSGHRRNASASVYQNTANVPLQRSNVPKTGNRPLSMYAGPYPEKLPPPPVQNQSSTRLNRSNTSSNSTAPPNARANVRTRSASILLNDSTILKPSIPSPSLVDPRRPAFSTLQQHFSPNKNLGPKPQTASYLAPPSPSKLPENKFISAETAKLQSELLQLHLLHRDSDIIRKEWEESARRKLAKKFEDVAGSHRQLVTLEGKGQSQINAAALKKWADGGHSAWGLEEMSMVLGEVITGVWNLSEPGGNYSKVVRRFEKWCSRVQGIMSAREEKSGEDSVQFIEGLDAAWTRESDNLTRKLETFKEQMDGLGVLENDGSSLAQVLNGSRELNQGMLMELGIMKKLEQEVLLREEEWIRQSIDEVSDGEDDVQGASWRR